MMDESRFWSLIQSARPATQQATLLRQMAFSGELEDDDELYTAQKQMLNNLTNALNQLDADDLLAFDRILERKLYDIDRADIQEYTGGSDDGFLYYYFVISGGAEGEALPSGVWRRRSRLHTPLGRDLRGPAAPPKDELTK